MINEKHEYFHDDTDTTIKELRQLIVGLEEVINDYSKEFTSEKNLNADLNDKISKLLHKTNELEQHVLILKEFESNNVRDNEEYQNKIVTLEKKASDTSKLLIEIKQENDSLRTHNKQLQNYNSEISSKYQEAEDRIQKFKHKLLELEQEQVVTKELRDSLEKEHVKLEESKKDYQAKFEQEKRQKIEKMQESLLLEEEKNTEISEKKIIIKKYYKAIVVSALLISGITGVYSFMFAELAGEKYRVQDISNIPTGYTIQNLRGDKVDTWISWRLTPGDSLKVNIVNADMHPKEKIEVVKNAILNNESIEIDNSLLHKGPKGTVSEYYRGWQGALKKVAEEKTEFYVPTTIEIIESRSGEGDVTIELVNAVHQDGFSGWTSSIIDESQNQILKSKVTIYNFNRLSNVEIETIILHEFGHVVGLAHSTDPDDLMAPTVSTNFPYISSCDIDAVKALYNGAKKSEVICQI